MPLVHVLGDDQVDLAALVLEQHEDDPVGGRGPLPRDREARVGDPSRSGCADAGRRSAASPPEGVGGAASAGGRRPRGPCGDSRPPSAPTASGPAAPGVATVGSSESVSCFASPRVPGTEAGRVASPSSQRRSRRFASRSAKQSHAPPSTSATRPSFESRERRARSPTSRKGPCASRSACSAFASSSPTESTYASPIRTACGLCSHLLLGRRRRRASTRPR